MRKKSVAVLMVTSLLIIGGVLHAPAIFATGADISSEPVQVFAVGPDPTIPGPGVIGAGSFVDIPGTSSKLVRTDNGVSISVHTSGLTPGAYTTWWVIDDDDGDPFFEMVFRAGGRIVGPNGEGDFGAGLSVDGIPEADFVTVVRNGDKVFNTPLTATVGMVIRYHGPVVEEIVVAQTSTFLGGCSNVGTTGITPSGTFVCFDPQITIHAP